MYHLIMENHLVTIITVDATLHPSKRKGKERAVDLEPLTAGMKLHIGYWFSFLVTHDCAQ